MNININNFELSPLRVTTRRVEKLTIIIVAIFMLFFGGFEQIVYAQYDDAGGYNYPSFSDAGGYEYPSVSDVGGYIYPTIADAGGYNYPSVGDAGGYEYPTVSDAGGYNYPSVSYPETYSYSSDYYGGYSYPSVSYPGTYNYPSIDWGSYSYPSVSYPSVPTYPTTNWGNYSYPSSYGGYFYDSYSTPIAYTTPIAYAATPTGPVNDILWAITIGLPLSVAAYLIIFRIRFKGHLTFAEAYRNASLERKIRKIKKAEIKSDAYVFQS